MAPREGFEPPRPTDSGFRIHRNTGLCDLGSGSSTYESDIRLTRPEVVMRIHVDSGEELLVVESEAPITVNQVLERLGIQPSTVLAVHDGTIVPHTSLITDDLQMEIVVVSSGG